MLCNKINLAQYNVCMLCIVRCMMFVQSINAAFVTQCIVHCLILIVRCINLCNQINVAAVHCTLTNFLWITPLPALVGNN